MSSKLYAEQKRQLEAARAEQIRANQDHQRQLEAARAEQIRANQDHQRQLEHVQKTAEGNAERMRKRMEAEIADLQRNLSKVEADLAKVAPLIHFSSSISNKFQANKDHIQDLQMARAEYTANMADQAARLKRAEEKAKDFESRSNTATLNAEKSEAALADKESERQRVQSELDDLLMVFGDLEEKKDKYKEQLKTLGEPVSDDDEEDEDDEDDEDGDDVD